MTVFLTGAKPPEPPELTGRIPPLENGDRLTRAEFERRYEAMPDLKKAELIDGEVYVASPVRHKRHSKPHGQLITWIGTYAAGSPGVDFGDNGTIRLDMDNEPQPDVYLMLEPEHGGRARISDDDFVEGAPELVAEVAASILSYDLGKKLVSYRRNGVREYIVWCVLDRELDWFVLHEGGYERLSPAADGLLRSAVFPGLWLDPAALIRGDLARVLAVVREGVANR
jgi:Uma2 family endonuclease